MTELETAMPTHDVSQVRVVTASSCAAALPVEPPAVRAAAAAADPHSRRAWLSVGALAVGAFVIVMTETLPVGLLPQIADGLDVSLGLGGLMVLVPGFSAAVSAPLFFLGSGRSNRRPVILFLRLWSNRSDPSWWAQPAELAPTIIAAGISGGDGGGAACGTVPRQPRRLASHFRDCGGGDTACRGFADGRAARYSA